MSPKMLDLDSNPGYRSIPGINTPLQIWHGWQCNCCRWCDLVLVSLCTGFVFDEKQIKICFRLPCATTLGSRTSVQKKIIKKLCNLHWWEKYLAVWKTTCAFPFRYLHCVPSWVLACSDLCNVSWSPQCHATLGGTLPRCQWSPLMVAERESK